MNKQSLARWVLPGMVGASLLTPLITHAVPAAQSISQGLNQAADGTYSQNVTLTVFIGNLIQALLTATGIIFLCLTVYAGILYMTATGDEKKVTKAKGMLVNAVIGVVIIIGAYAITQYVVVALTSVSGGTEATQTTTPPS